jgi:hypothetical protein
MRIDADETSVTLSDRPVVERALNAFMAVAGGFTTWLCLRFYAPGGDWGDLTLVLFTPFLLAFALLGFWRLLSLPTTHCRVDGKRRVIERSLRAPLVDRNARWTFDEVAEIHTDERPGYDSSWRPMLVLRDTRRVALAPHANADRETVERFVLEARRIMTIG